MCIRDRGVISADDITGEIGDLIDGKVPGRTSDTQTTIFDATGLYILDLAAAVGDSDAIITVTPVSYTHLDVYKRQNLTMAPIKIKKVPKSEAEQKAMALLQRVGLVIN